ncbi:ATP-dependent Clp protease, protease subunit [Streptomyces wuyuanensis]|uniref:ATP-dependent Clp protease proteolytic subunit n=2 Tax=Streptomyces TaxID=1883 RepID=A0A1G9SIA9_9ACTN|nr:ATP-dependent Clp protease, protease subunit [Streptomyces wuyuanensis]
MAPAHQRVRVHEYEGRGLPARGDPPAPRFQDAETAAAVRDEQVDYVTILMPNAAGEPSIGGGLGDQVYSRLLGERIIFLGQQVDDDIANKITAQLLLLAADPEKDIYLYINSPGGSVTAGMAIYDTMQYIPNDVVTIGMGMAASMGQFLLTGGATGKRFALPHTDILMHQGSAGIGGTASDIKIQAEYLLRTKQRMAEITARHSGQTVETIIRDGDRDRWFTAEEAKDYGLIDEIISAASGVPGGGGTGA